MIRQVEKKYFSSSFNPENKFYVLYCIVLHVIPDLKERQKDVNAFFQEFYGFCNKTENNLCWVGPGILFIPKFWLPCTSVDGY